MNCFFLTIPAGYAVKVLFCSFKREENKILGRGIYLEPLLTGVRCYHDHL